MNCKNSTIDFYEPSQERAAVALCRTCPRLAECAQEGAREPFGVWGATTPKDRGFRTRRAMRKREPSTTKADIVALLQDRHHTVNQIATRLPVTKSAIKAALASLEAEGVVLCSRKKPHPNLYSLVNGVTK